MQPGGSIEDAGAAADAAECGNNAHSQSPPQPTTSPDEPAKQQRNDIDPPISEAPAPGGSPRSAPPADPRAPRRPPSRKRRPSGTAALRAANHQNLGSIYDDEAIGPPAIEAALRELEGELRGPPPGAGGGGGAAADDGILIQPPQLFAMQNLPVLARADSELSVLTCNSDRDEAALLLAHLLETRQQRARMSKSRVAEVADRVMEAGDTPSRWLELLGRELDQMQIDIPTVEVRYRDLTVTARATLGTPDVPSVASSIVNPIKRLLRLIPPPVTLSVVNHVSGVIKPRRLTLLLSPPGAGKSVFLRALAGNLNNIKSLKVSGAVTYNGLTAKDCVVPRTVAYVSQHDEHTPQMTVEQTLRFAQKCAQGDGIKVPDRLRTALMSDRPVRLKSSWLADTRRDEDLFDDIHEALAVAGSGEPGQFATEILLRAMGLLECRSTPVGSAMARGVSGGQRKRVTTAELLAAHRTCVLMDEISTGLDSATLFAVVRHLGAVCHNLKATYVVSLLQPPPEVFDLFDDIIVMAAGRILYHGPRAEVRGFFEGLGFTCPPRKDLPSWLMELTTPRGQLQYASPPLAASRGGSGGGGAGVGAGVVKGGGDPECGGAGGGAAAPLLEPLMSAEEISDHFWRESSQGAAMLSDLDSGYHPSSPEDQGAMSRRRWTMGFISLLGVAVSKQLLLLKADAAIIRSRLLQTCVISALSGSLFFQMPHTALGARSFMGASFLAVMYQVMSNGPSLVSVLVGKPVWFKHRDHMFYPSLVEALSLTFAQSIPSIMDSFLYTIIMYYMIGFCPSASYYFTFWLVCLSTNLCMGSMYRLLAASCQNLVAAQSYGGVIQLVLVLTSGFTIVRGSIPPYWVWAYYISPYSYAVRALVVNELTSPPWSVPGTGAKAGVTLGQEMLLAFEFEVDRYWIWVGVAYLLGLGALMALMTAWALARAHPASPQPFVVEGDERQFEGLKGHHPAKPPKPPAARRGAGEPDGVTGGAGSEEEAGAEQQRQGSGRAAAPPGGGAGGKGAVQSGTGGGVQSGPGLVLPKPPQVTLVWKDLRYFVPRPKGPGSRRVAASRMLASAAAALTGGGKQQQQQGQQHQQRRQGGAGGEDRLELLKGLSGFVRPYDLLALMGGSGAGKTTLMDVLAGRKTIGHVEGEILVNGRPKNQASWSRVLGYCEQSDIHSPGTTLEEALWTSARLRLPQAVSNKQVQAVVDDVLAEVDMTPMRLSLVGAPGGLGLTVEQRKRMTIAVELVANPGIIMMDEPTSGLDARAAVIVMKAVQAVAAGGRAVMVTIHQPSIDIFEGFGRLYLMQRGGRLTYFGDLGDRSCDLVTYLEAVPGTPSLPNGANPATWMLEVTGAAKALKPPPAAAAPTKQQQQRPGGGQLPGGGGSSGGRSSEGEGDANGVDSAAAAGRPPNKQQPQKQQEQEPLDWPSHYSSSALAAANDAAADALVKSCLAGCPELEVSGRYAAPFRVQFTVLLSKFFSVYWRTVSYNRTRIIMAVVLSLAYGSMYYRVGVLPVPATIANVQNLMGVIYSANNFMGMINLYMVMPVMGSERIVFYRERGASMYNPFAYGLAIAVVELPYLLFQAALFVPIVYFTAHFSLNARDFFMFFTMIFLCVTYYTIFGQWLVYFTPTQQLAQTLGANSNFAFNLVNGFMQPYPMIPVYWKWLNRLVPSTWALYGLVGGQLANNTAPLVFAGQVTTVSAFLGSAFGIYRPLVPWSMVIMVGHILFVRVTSILALRYLNFLRR